jgi:CubicO group peptidase (beta-lactamase class C family)
MAASGRLKFAAAALALLSLCACRTSQTLSQAARVDELFAQWNTKDAPGCAVGVSHNGAIVYTRGYGMANIELGVPMTPSTVLSVASISKSFTAMSVLLAAREGKLSLDDEVQKYVPEWTDREDHITIRHLLTHTSGLRDAFTLFGWAPSPPWGDVNKSVVSMLARQRGLNFLPGTEYSYNNGGYNLLASILERATGQPLRVFADANIFKPLGMTHSFFMDEPTKLMAGRAPGYTRHEDGWHLVLPVAGPAVVGNAGMYSTVGDLLLWAQNFETARVGTPEMLAAMQKPTVLKNGQEATGHGLGVGLDPYRGTPGVGTSGGDYGMASNLTLLPKHRFAAAVICNEDNAVMGGMARVNPDALSQSVADIYLGDVLAPVAAASSPAPSSPTTRVKLTEKELSEQAGLYAMYGVDFPARMKVDHGVLMVRSYYGEDFDFAIEPLSAHQFLFQNRIPFAFTPATAGRPKQWLVGEGKDQRVWEEVTLALSPTELRAYTGRFHSDELDLTYTLEATESGLVTRGTYFQGNEVTLSPFAKDVFVGDLVGIVKFSRDARGAITTFTINRAVANGIRFDRVR